MLQHDVTFEMLQNCVILLTVNTDSMDQKEINRKIYTVELTHYHYSCMNVGDLMNEINVIDMAYNM